MAINLWLVSSHGNVFLGRFSATVESFYDILEDILLQNVKGDILVEYCKYFLLNSGATKTANTSQ